MVRKLELPGGSYLDVSQHRNCFCAGIVWYYCSIRPRQKSATKSENHLHPRHAMHAPVGGPRLSFNPGLSERREHRHYGLLFAVSGGAGDHSAFYWIISTASWPLGSSGGACSCDPVQCA